MPTLPSSWEWWHDEPAIEWRFHVSLDPECAEFPLVLYLTPEDVTSLGQQHWATDHEFPADTSCVKVQAVSVDGTSEISPYPIAVNEPPFVGAIIAALLIAWGCWRFLR